MLGGDIFFVLEQKRLWNERALELKVYHGIH